MVLVCSVRWDLRYFGVERIVMRRYWAGLFLILLVACGESNETRMQRFLAQGNDMIRKQNYGEAENYFDQALKFDSCYAEAWNNKATLYFNQQKYTEAVDGYTHALTCHPDYTDAYFNRAHAYYELREYYNALADLDRFKKIKPDTSTAFFLEGLIYTHMRKYDDALAAFDRAEKLDRTNAEILVNKGTVLYYKKQFSEARSALQRALKMKTEANAYNVLAMIETEAGNYPQALKWINLALNLRHEDAFFLNNRGYIYLMMNSLPKALEDIDQSIRLDPFNGWSYRNKGVYYLLDNKPDDAIRLFDQAEKMDGTIDKIHLYRAKAYARKGDKSKACQDYGLAQKAGEPQQEELEKLCR